MKKDIFTEGCFYVNNQIFDEELSAAAKLIYMYLAKCADCFGKCWPAHKTIGEACSMSVSLVKEALSELKQHDKITISHRFREAGGKSSNLYMIMDRSKEKSFSASPLIFARDLSAKAKLVYFYFCRCADQEGNCFPAHKTTAAKCSMGYSTVRKALAELLEAAIIGATTRFRANEGQTSNLYTLLQIVNQAVQNVKEKIRTWKEGKSDNSVQSAVENKDTAASRSFSPWSSWLKKRIRFFRAGGIDNIEQGGCSVVAMKELNPD